MLTGLTGKLCAISYMIHQVDDYELCFTSIAGCGPATFHALCAYFGSAEAAYFAPLQRKCEALGEARARKLEQQLVSYDERKVRLQLQKKDISFIGYSNDAYPAILKTLPDAPIGLFCRGDIGILKKIEEEKTIAIVGTRNVTGYGRQVTMRIADVLSQEGYVIVSGMAQGVDEVAHNKALKHGNPTIAFLGCGVDVVYPQSNASLYEEILEGGLLVSEFMPGQQPSPGLFIARNRLISAVSMGVVVIEGTYRSGALVTARFAAEQAKDVFAVPGPITTIYSEGPNALIRDGAHIVCEPEDILRVFGVKGGDISHTTPITERALWSKLSELEQSIIKLILNEPKTTDEIVDELQCATSTVLNTLSLLQLQGVVEKNTESRYYLVW